MKNPEKKIILTPERPASHHSFGGRGERVRACLYIWGGGGRIAIGMCLVMHVHPEINDCRSSAILLGSLYSLPSLLTFHPSLIISGDSSRTLLSSFLSITRKGNV